MKPTSNLSLPSVTVRHGEEMTAFRLAAILEFSCDAIFDTDINGVIFEWNKSAERILGYSAAEIIGTSFARLIPADRRAEEQFLLEKIRQGENVEHFETIRQAKDGRRVDVSLTISPIRDGLGEVIGASRIARDITVQKEHEREVARLNRLYAALSHVNQAIARLSTRTELFEKVCQALVAHGGFHMAWVGWHNPDTNEIAPQAVAGDDAGYIRGLTIYADERPQGCGPTGLAFRLGRPYICNEILDDPVTLPWRRDLAASGLHSLAAFPIQINHAVCGTLNVYSDEPRFFRDKEIALLVEAARDVAQALETLAEKEARQAVEQMARDERIFSATMIESMPGILYFYNEHGRFLRWNRTFEVVSGYSDAEIARMHPLDFFTDDEKELLTKRIGEVFTVGESDVEAHFRTKDGRTILYFFTGRRVYFNGAPCLVGMGMDITARKRAEMALRVLNQTLELEVSTRTSDLKAALVRAEAADRIKSAFLATMSHELRTPLNSIIGFTGIVLQGLAGPLNPEQTKQLGMVRGSARHLLELINDVLDLSKIEAGQMEIRAEPFDLRESLELVVASVRPLAEKKGLTLAIIGPAELGQLNTDRRRLEQLLLNLLNNGIKFTECGGVTLTAELALPPPAGEADPAVVLRVTDTGMGIKPENLALLFQPFRQIDTGTTRQYEGTGLGLAICRHLAALLGGEIRVTSEWGHGSEFAVTLPRHQPANHHETHHSAN